MVEASCHCGNVKIVVPEITELLTSCNCSLCYKYAALWAYFSFGEVNFKIEERVTKSYSWGKETREFYHCDTCGCLTHYTQKEFNKKNKIAVNFRLVNSDIVNSLNIHFFDDAHNL